MENIHSELERNLEILDIIHPGNQAALLSVQSESAEDDSSTITPGLVLQDAAWATMVSSGISAHVPYPELFRIAEVYKMQEVYKTFSQNFITSLQSARSTALALGNEISESEAITAHADQLALMLSIEAQLKGSIEGVLDRRYE